MSELAVAAIICACVLGGAAAGIRLRHVLPEHHMNEQSRQIVNVAIGLIATLAALVLGLLVASAKSSFDDRNEEVKSSAAKIILLDRVLRQYGPEAQPTRDLLRELTQRRIERTFGKAAFATVTSVNDAKSAEQLRAALFELAPNSDAQRWLVGRALAIVSEIEEARWLLVEENRSSIPTPFLVVLVFWLSVIFASLGLYAPPNATVYAILIVCALSVSTAIYMILEMDQPYDGLLRISPMPLRNALDELKQP